MSDLERSSDETYTDEEIEWRMNVAVRRALVTPPQPHTAKPKPPAAKPATRVSRKRAIAGKPLSSA